MNILITGGFGYAGSILSEEFAKRKHQVVIVDNLHTGIKNNKILNKYENLEFYNFDITNMNSLKKAFKKFKYDCVIHLAAIVGDPACRKDIKLTNKTNLIGAKNVFKLSKENKAKKFIFYSTCSNYGIMKNTSLVSEKSKLRPISHYAKTKVKFEKYLINDKSKISKIIFRVSTLYGMSKRMRFDLTINEFVKTIFLNKKLQVYDKNTWRPYLHLRDLFKVTDYFLNKKISSNVNILNVGKKNENYSKESICKIIQKKIKNREKLIKYIDKTSVDMRDYKVDFSKIDKIKIKLNFDVSKGVSEIIKAITKNKYLRNNSSKFINH